MAWVAFDRFVQRNETRNLVSRDMLERISALREAVHEEIYREGRNAGAGAFTRYYGSHLIDASVLLLPLRGFLPVDDCRIASTITTIGREPGEGGLIRRQKTTADGRHEGGFLAGSCWMAECMHLPGRNPLRRGATSATVAGAGIGVIVQNPRMHPF